MNDSIILRMTNLAEYLGVPLSHARNLMHRVDFPTYVIGQTLYTTKPAVDRWLLLEHKQEEDLDYINPQKVIEGRF